jgi:hypothetical protein
MRLTTLPMMAALAVLASAASAQTDAPEGTPAYPPAAPGPPSAPLLNGPLPEADAGAPGLNKVAPDGVSSKTVRAVPCSTAARDTDGSTTCIGIPEGKKRR